MSSDRTFLYRKIKIQSSVEAAFAAVSEQQHLRRWFSPNVELEGGSITVWGPAIPHVKEQARASISRYHLVEGSAFEYELHWNDRRSTVRWEVREESGEAVVSFKAELPGNDDAMVWYQLADAADVWLANLKEYVENGRTMIEPDTLGPRNLAMLSVQIHATEEDVFSALTRPDVMNRWISSDASVELRDGGAYSYGWSEEIEGTPVPTGPTKILKVQAPHVLSHDWKYKGEDYSQVSWFIEGSGGQTTLTITHCGFGGDWTDSYTLGWAAFLCQVKLLLEQRDRPSAGEPLATSLASAGA